MSNFAAQKRKYKDMEYMSQEGYDKLVAELKQLENVELPRVREAIAEARAQGDLSENFEYHAAKREQGKLLGRIRFLQRVLEFARVIDTSKLRSDGIGLLNKVEMTNLGTGAKMTYTIVSPHEANMAEGIVFNRSITLSASSVVALPLIMSVTGLPLNVRFPSDSITPGMRVNAS